MKKMSFRWFGYQGLQYVRHLSVCQEKKIERFKWCQTKYKEPKVILANGATMPIIGLGTWLSPKDKVATAVKTAIGVGYRLIDCAQIYQNEAAVGSGIQSAIKKGIVKREELFVVGKLWNTFHRSDLVKSALEQSLDDLKLKYLDLYLMHWPMGYKEGCDLFPTGKNGQAIFSNVDYLETWKEMEKMVESGLTKTIGISNFNRKQISRLLENAKIKPIVHQIECHPYLQQRKLASFCKVYDIAVMAYSPLGSPKRPWAAEDEPVLLEEEGIKKIAEKKKKSAAQIVLRYQVQRGNIVVPKSVTADHIKSNYKIFDFDLSEKEIKAIEKLERNGRLVSLLREAGKHKYYPFHEEY